MLRTLFVSALIAAGLTAGAVNRFAALLFYVWFALFRPMEWVWIDLSALRPSLIAGLMLVIPSLLTGRGPTIAHPLSFGSLLFLGAAGLAHTQALEPTSSLLWLDYISRLIVVCLFAVTLTNTRQRLVALLAVMAGSFGVHAAKAGLVSLINGGVRYYEGLAGAFVDNNGYALGAAMTVFLLLAVAQNVRSRVIAIGFYLAVPLTAMTVISTFSRGGLLALAAGTLVWLLLQKRRVLSIAVVACAVTVALAVMPLPSGYADRMETIQTEEESAMGRLHFWQVAVVMSADNPLGVGLWNYEAAYDRYDFSHGRFGTRRSVHSSHLQVLSETGYIGALVYASLFVWALFIALRVRARARLPHVSEDDARCYRTTANAVLASMAAFVVGGSFIAMALNDLTWMTFAVLASLDRISAAPAVATVAETAPVPGNLSTVGVTS